MDSIFRADIFFIVTTVVVILVGAAMLAALYYAIRILRDAKHISREISEETESIIKDIDLFRKGTKKGSSLLIAVLRRLIPGALKKKRKRSR